MFTLILSNGTQVTGDVLDGSDPNCISPYLSTCSNNVISQHLREVNNMHSFLFIHATESAENPVDLRNKVVSINPAQIIMMY